MWESTFQQQQMALFIKTLAIFNFAMLLAARSAIPPTYRERFLQKTANEIMQSGAYCQYSEVTYYQPSYFCDPSDSPYCDYYSQKLTKDQKSCPKQTTAIIVAVVVSVTAVVGSIVFTFLYCLKTRPGQDGRPTYHCRKRANSGKCCMKRALPLVLWIEKKKRQKGKEEASTSKPHEEDFTPIEKEASKSPRPSSPTKLTGDPQNNMITVKKKGGPPKTSAVATTNDSSVMEKKPLVVYNPEERAVNKFKYKSNLPELQKRRSILLQQTHHNVAPVSTTKFKEPEEPDYQPVQPPRVPNPNVLNLPSITDLSQMKSAIITGSVKGNPKPSRMKNRKTLEPSGSQNLFQKRSVSQISEKSSSPNEEDDDAEETKSKKKKKKKKRKQPKFQEDDGSQIESLRSENYESHISQIAEAKEKDEKQKEMARKRVQDEQAAKERKLKEEQEYGYEYYMEY
ncbi:hypothetical protein FGO68_gene12341 [Halteria grandinella]|uniref:Uncharacterized protein n=1 Tax=Halteria grandinella TaxID=5974 RepID=A0A8J8NMP9_HALGN|nr:hypothetical protein FGO68_gene12341 [Halteria grandinella]